MTAEYVPVEVESARANLLSLSLTLSHLAYALFNLPDLRPSSTTEYIFPVILPRTEAGELDPTTLPSVARDSNSRACPGSQFCVLGATLLESTLQCCQS